MTITIADVDVIGLGPLASAVPQVNALTPGQVIVGLARGTNFNVPANVIQLDFHYTGTAPTIGSFNITACDLADQTGSAPAGDGCSKTNFVLM